MHHVVFWKKKKKVVIVLILDQLFQKLFNFYEKIVFSQGRPGETESWSKVGIIFKWVTFVASRQQKSKSVI